MKIATAIAVIGLAAASPAAAGYRITVVDGPASPALLGTVVNGINNNGLVSGYYVLAGDPMMGQPPQNYFGFTANADGSNFTSYSRSGYEQTGASGIDDAGTTVGVSVLAYGTGNGFVRTANGAYTDIVPTYGADTPSAYSEVIDINNVGDLVGFYTETLPPSLDQIQQYSHGFIYSGGVFTTLDVPSLYGFGTQLFSMNSSGTVSGSFLDNIYGAPHGFLYNSTTGFVVPSIGGEFASSVGEINDYGSFGFATLTANPFSPTGFNATAYLAKGDAFTPGGVSFTPFAVPGAFSTEIHGINNRNDLTGYFIDANGIHGFVAQAVPEPASWAMVIAGFGLVGAMQRRRRRQSSTARLAMSIT